MPNMRRVTQTCPGLLGAQALPTRSIDHRMTASQSRSLAAQGWLTAFLLAASARPGAAQVPFIHEVSGVVKTALQTQMTFAQFLAAEAPLIPLSDVKVYGCDIANFALGRVVPAAPPSAAEACAPVRSRDGFFLFGTTLPGSLRPFNTMTAFLPTASAGCANREYGVTLSIAGANRPAAELPSEAFKALYRAVGDFAIVGVINHTTRTSTIYMMAADVPRLTQAAALEKTPESPYGQAVKAAKLMMSAAMSGSTENVAAKADAVAGNPINSQLAGACNVPTFLWYIAGTASVRFT
jgi:hypothetical protein